MLRCRQDTRRQDRKAPTGRGPVGGSRDRLPIEATAPAVRKSGAPQPWDLSGLSGIYITPITASFSSLSGLLPAAGSSPYSSDGDIHTQEAQAVVGSNRFRLAFGMLRPQLYLFFPDRKPLDRNFVSEQGDPDIVVPHYGLVANHYKIAFRMSVSTMGRLSVQGRSSGLNRRVYCLPGPRR